MNRRKESMNDSPDHAIGELEETISKSSELARLRSNDSAFVMFGAHESRTAYGAEDDYCLLICLFRGKTRS